MTLDEKIGQMTQADMKALKDGKEVHDFLLGLRAVGRRLAAQAERTRDLGRNVRPATRARRCRRGSGSRCSTASTPSTATAASRARRSSRTTSAWAARAIPAIVEAAARVTAREIAGTGHRLDLRALPRGRARRALGAHLRELRRGRPSWSRAWAPRPSAASSRRPTAAAILATAKHFLADGGTAGGKDQGDAQHLRGGAAPASTCPATSPPSRPASAA